MAYFDHEAARRRQQSEEKFIELKKHITSKEDGVLNEWFPAMAHITDMEKTIDEQILKIEEYQRFFSMMQKLMPRQHSIHDIIG